MCRDAVRGLVQHIRVECVRQANRVPERLLLTENTEIGSEQNELLVRTGHNFMYEYDIKLNRVIDGDTIVADIDLGFDVWLKDQYIRLSGVDTPELKSKDKLHRAAGLLAKTKLTEFLSSARGLLLKSENFQPEDDKYGRILGTIITDRDENVNHYLLNNRYGVPYNGQNKGEIMKAHAANIEFLTANGFLQI